MIKHAILKLFSSKYRRASNELERAKKLIQALAVSGSISVVRR